ncbi:MULTISPECIES: ABC transporter substrate-binding protein [unclassified Pseudactinotalea]|uniref:ABC transporter substrate-binding protein n=1 Tax=unclassified Pseudactinotalea TaxID=2649176 RepID=UPI00128CE115|nr:MULTISPECIES: ABC transporter substrate-binding protein [unclassified Pseudactinotalea]MPV49066.1 sugar ABC transporter substrate-binding protein [Pseudactinotalea sp. HY160]QGH68261.1 sugar ABC transporter substrate-binding protein [Pseudactinotalea sp. HY158]
MTNVLPRRRALALTGVLGAAALALAACGSSGEAAGTPDGDAAGGDGLTPITVGISQFVQHPALDAATTGFKQAFLDAGYVEGETVTFDEQNAAGDVANTTTIASTFAGDDLDLVLAVATPSAQAAAQALTDVPVLFTAVTDPVAAGLVASNEAPGANVTGTSDLNPVADQLALLKEILPDATKVGIVYSSGEVNSEVQVELAKEAAGGLGLEIVEATITNASEIQQSAESLGDVDAIYVPTDNAVVSGIAALVQLAESKGIALIGAEAGTVEGGAIATVGIDYEALGLQTGEMGVAIVDGADPATMPVETLKTLQLVINPAAAERMGVTLPDSVVDRADKVIE